MRYYIQQQTGPKVSLPSMSYSTSFPVNENPISEGGRWINQDPYSTNVRVITRTGGVQIACGTQVAGPNAPYDDSQAYLLGFPINHGCRGTIYKASGFPAEPPNHEVELRLRQSDTTGPGFDPGGGYGLTTVRGYELNVNASGAYMNIARFKEAGTLQSIVFTSVYGRAPADGDIYEATVHDVAGGAQITVKWNGTQVMQVTDPSPFLIGGPGMGFYIDGAIDTTLFGFRHYEAFSL